MSTNITYHSLGRWREIETSDIWEWEQIESKGPDATMRLRRLSDNKTRTVTRDYFPRQGWERTNETTS